MAFQERGSSSSTALSVVHVQRWAPEEVATWLGTIGLGRYADRFMAQNVGGDVLFDLGMPGLKELGVDKIGDRLRLQKALEALKEEAQSGPRPRLGVAVLGANPLVHVRRIGDRTKVLPLGRIDFRREQDLLRNAVRTSRHFMRGGGLEPTFNIGTFAALARVLREGAVVLAVTGHTTEDGKILLETETGEAAEFDPWTALPQMLAGVPGCTASGNGAGSTVHVGGDVETSRPSTMPLCVVLSSCYSREVGRAFLHFGARHVVAVERTQTVLDSAARVFNENFHHALLVGKTVAAAFGIAVAHVRHSSRHIPEEEAGKFVLLPEDKPRRHDVALFGPSPCGNLTPTTVLAQEVGQPHIGRQRDMWQVKPWRHDAALFGPSSLTPTTVLAQDGTELAHGGCQQLQTEQEQLQLSAQLRSEAPRIIGRQRDMWQVIRALGKTRCVAVCGVGGVGKATLCRGVAGFLEERGRRHCANGVHIASLRGIRTVHAAAAQIRQALSDEALDAKAGGTSARPVSEGRDLPSALAPASDVSGADLSSEDVEVAPVGGGLQNAAVQPESWEQVFARLGERLLLLTSAEELLHAEPREAANLLESMFAAAPRLRVLLTSRRTVPAEAWIRLHSIAPVSTNDLEATLGSNATSVVVQSRTQRGAPKEHDNGAAFVHGRVAGSDSAASAGSVVTAPLCQMHLRQLEPEESREMLLHMAPTLGDERLQEIASLCGHLPLALKVVGQRLAVASDPLADAGDFVAEAKNSPEKRASMLFSQCVAPYVWRTLHPARRDALAALSLFRNAFDLFAAKAVLGVSIEQTRLLLRELQDQCLVERLSETTWYMPTSVHLVVQQQPSVTPPVFAPPSVTESAELTPPTPSSWGVTCDKARLPVIDLAGASLRMVLRFLGLLKEVSAAAARDRGRGAAGLDALRAFDRQRGDVDTALALAGNSDLFVAMVQFGSEIFETRLSAQRRVDIYERLLGILMEKQRVSTTAVASSSATLRRDQPQSAANGIRQLLRMFERNHPATFEHPSAASAEPQTGCGRWVARRIPPVSQTVPNTPIGGVRKRCSLSDCEQDNDGAGNNVSRVSSFSAADCSAGHEASRCALQAVQRPSPTMVGLAGFRKPTSASVPASPSANAKSQTIMYTPLRPPPQPPPSQQASSGLCPHTSPPLPQEAFGAPAAETSNRKRPAYRKPPSYVFATSDGILPEQAEQPVQSANSLVPSPTGTRPEEPRSDAGAAEDSDNVAVAWPSWCQPLSAHRNAELRPHMEAALRPAAPPAEASPARNAGRPCGQDLVGPPTSGLAWYDDAAHNGVLVEVLLRLGMAYADLGRYAHAAQLLRRALLRVEDTALNTRCIGLDPEGMRAELLGTLSGILRKQGLCQDAEAMLWQARQLAKIAEQHDLYVKLTCELAEFNQTYKGNLSTAHRLFKDGLQARVRKFGYEHLDTAATLSAVGLFMAQRGDNQEAKKFVKQAVTIRTKILGPSHILVADAFHDLAGILVSLLSLQEAAETYERALRIKKKVLPEAHVSIAETQNCLSIVYSKLKKHAQNVGLLRQCLDRCLCTVGEMHTSTASVLMNLGHALHSLATASRKNSSLSTYAYAALLDEAKGYLDRALVAKRTLLHKHHPSIAPCRADLGHVNLKKEDFASAKRHFRAAIRIFKRHSRDANPDVALWHYWLGKANLAIDCFEECEDNLREALRIADAPRPSQNLVSPEASQDLFSPEDLEDIHRILRYCSHDRRDTEGCSDSAAEPAAEPPSAADSGQACRKAKFVRQRPKTLLSLDEWFGTGAKDFPASKVTSPTPSSGSICSSDSTGNISTFPWGEELLSGGQPLPSPHGDPKQVMLEYDSIIRGVEQSVKDYVMRHRDDV